jgi:RNA polymerase sigma-70 factor, ECF subfamily
LTNVKDEIDPERWVKEHGDIMFRYAYVRLKSHAVAEDIVQETFLAAMKAKERYAGRSSERSWLMGILRHKLIDHLRKSAREVKMEDLEPEGFENTLLYKEAGIPHWQPPKWHFNPRKVFEQKEFWEVFSSCLAKLDDRMSAAFTMKELEGMSTEDVCKELGVEPTYLWVILYRARKGLKECLERNWLKRNTGMKEINAAV